MRVSSLQKILYYKHRIQKTNKTKNNKKGRNCNVGQKFNTKMYKFVMEDIYKTKTKHVNIIQTMEHPKPY